MQVLGYLLLIIHFFLLSWATGGFIEMISDKVPWEPFTNPAFPFWVLIIHWGSVLFASVCFIYGYIVHWSKTPKLMVISYGLMALVCIIETFGYMTGKTKYLAMGAEFVAYIVILFILFKTNYFITYFGNIRLPNKTYNIPASDG